MVRTIGALALTGLAAGTYLGVRASSPVAVEPRAQRAPADPGPRSPAVQRGLVWLAARQNPDGGFGQGEESPAMQRSGAALRDVSNVADTAMAALALLRSGSSPTEGPYAGQIRRAVEFVSNSVLAAPAGGLAVTEIQGTRLQAKLGGHIDTFLASLLLTEVKDSLPPGEVRSRAIAAQEKILHKMANHQNADGTWGGDGWAPALAQGMASKALNRAAQGGFSVVQETLVRAERYAASQFDAASGDFRPESAAGVELYQAGASVIAMDESDRTNANREQELQSKLDGKTLSDAERASAMEEIKRIEGNREALARAQGAVIRKMKDPSFVAGFGSNGGEEFLSYLNIGESLFLRGGDDWTAWRTEMNRNLERIQNGDGSWTGHHCITGRTFCTAAALLVLTIDRAPRAIAAGIRRG